MMSSTSRRNRTHTAHKGGRTQFAPTINFIVSRRGDLWSPVFTHDNRLFFRDAREVVPYKLTLIFICRGGVPPPENERISRIKAGEHSSPLRKSLKFFCRGWRPRHPETNKFLHTLPQPVGEGRFCEANLPRSEAEFACILPKTNVYRA